MNKKSVFLSGIALSFALCSALFAAPGSVELKLLVKPELFADRSAGYTKLWSVVQEKAAVLQMAEKAEQKPEEESILVRYYDTAEKTLGAKNYTVRQKFKIKKGNPEETGELMLKLRRGEEIPEADQKAFKEGLDEKAKYKYEEDRVGIAEGVPGKTRSAYSVSAKFKKQPEAKGKSVEWLCGYFPTLKPVDLDKAGLLAPVTEDVISVEAEIGKVKVSDKDKAELETAVWYNTDKSIRLVELSWKYKPKAGTAEAHEKLFRALQDSDIFLAGKTKTEK